MKMSSKRNLFLQSPTYEVKHVESSQFNVLGSLYISKGIAGKVRLCFYININQVIPSNKHLFTWKEGDH